MNEAVLCNYKCRCLFIAAFVVDIIVLGVSLWFSVSCAPLDVLFGGGLQ
jgi:hypothetical protein